MIDIFWFKNQLVTGLDWTFWYQLALEYSRSILEQNLAEADVTVEDKMNILKNFEKKEMEYMRLQRQKMGVDDFELLSIIGRGAFGEVYLFMSFYDCLSYFSLPFCKLS